MCDHGAKVINVNSSPAVSPFRRELAHVHERIHELSRKGFLPTMSERVTHDVAIIVANGLRRTNDEIRCALWNAKLPDVGDRVLRAIKDDVRKDVYEH